MNGNDSATSTRCGGGRCGTQQLLQRRGVDEGGRLGKLRGDPGEQSGSEKTPTDRSDARSVRAAKAVPTSARTKDRNVIVVACRSILLS
jgi:hypothetical protein